MYFSKEFPYCPNGQVSSWQAQLKNAPITFLCTPLLPVGHARMALVVA